MQVDAFSSFTTRRSAPTPAPTPKPTPSVEAQDSFVPQLLGGLAGALVGAVAGQAGPQAVSALAGVAGAASTASVAVPYLSGAVRDGLNGDPLNDLALVCGTTFAGGVLIASSGAGAAALAYPLALALPGGGPILGAIIGGAAGAHLAG